MANCALLELTTNIVMQAVHAVIYTYTSRVAPDWPSPLLGDGIIRTDWVVEIHRYIHEEVFPSEYIRAGCTGISRYLDIVHTEDLYNQFVWNSNSSSTIDV